MRDAVKTPPANLERRALSGSVANLASILAILLQNLALVPILLHYWSADSYGIWITLLAVQSLLFTANYGQETYVGNESARLLHQDPQALPQMIGAGICLGLALTLAEVLLVIAVGLLHFTSIFSKLLGAGAGEAWLPLAIVIGCWVGFGSTANILIRVNYALGYYSRFTFFTVASRVLTTLAVAGSALLHGGLWGAAVAYGTATLISQGIIMTVTLRMLRRHQVSIALPGFRLVFAVLKNSAVISGTSLLDGFSNNGLLTIISSVLTARVVPAFSTLRTIANTANQGIGIIMHPLGPDIIRFRANKEFSKLYEVFSVCWATAGTLINFGLCILPIFIEPVYRIWTRGKLTFNFPLFALLSLSVAFRTLGHPGLAFLQSTNSLNAQAKISVVRATLVIVLSLVLIHPMGLLGVGLALAFSELVGATILPLWYAMKDFETGGVPFPFHRMVNAAISVGVVALSFAICCFMPTLKLMAGSVAAITVLVLGYLQWTMLDPDTRRRMLSILHVPKWLGVNVPLAGKAKPTMP